MIGEIPSSVLSRFAWRSGVERVELVPPGMSGATVFRVQLASGDRFAVKRYPPSVSPDRLRWIHGLMNVARRGGCDLVPELCRLTSGQTTVLDDAGHRWDAAQWQPGTPLDPQTTRNHMLAGVSAISCFHQSVVGNRTPVQSTSPGLGERLRILSDASKRFPKPIDAVRLAMRINQQSPHWPQLMLTSPGENASGSKLEIVMTGALELLSRHWRDQARRWADLLAPWAQRVQDSHGVLRDVHREHLLFDGECPSALIDFDAARVDWPELDLARWAGSFLPSQLDGGAGAMPPNEYWSQVAACYHRPVDSHLLESISAASTWISLSHWIGWIAEGRRFPAGPGAVACRIDELCRRAAELLET